MLDSGKSSPSALQGCMWASGVVVPLILNFGTSLSNHFHDPVALLVAKQSLIPILWEDGWAKGPVRSGRTGEEKNLLLVWDRIRNAGNVLKIHQDHFVTPRNSVSCEVTNPSGVEKLPALYRA